MVDIKYDADDMLCFGRNMLKTPEKSGKIHLLFGRILLIILK